MLDLNDRQHMKELVDLLEFLQTCPNNTNKSNSRFKDWITVRKEAVKELIKKLQEKNGV